MAPSKSALLIVFTVLMITAAPTAHGAATAAVTTTVSKEDMVKASARIRSEVPKDFIIVEQSPFIIAGNLTKEEMAHFVEGTVQSASNAFWKMYFDKKPDKVITIYLFGDDKSYREYAKKLFGDEPGTPYGYYTPGANRLVMNIATGGGTLVHELFHALVRYDFPKIPDWTNEGMASLYEQCNISGNKLKGLINWRYPILIKHIKKDDCVSLEDLIATKDSAFYIKDNGSNYPAARYFCLYMQEKGLLEKFYKDFRDNADKDTTGKKTIETLFSKPLEKIEQDWLKWAKALDSE